MIVCVLTRCILSHWPTARCVSCLPVHGHWLTNYISIPACTRCHLKSLPQNIQCTVHCVLSCTGLQHEAQTCLNGEWDERSRVLRSGISGFRGLVFLVPQAPQALKHALKKLGCAQGHVRTRARSLAGLMHMMRVVHRGNNNGLIAATAHMPHKRNMPDLLARSSRCLWQPVGFDFPPSWSLDFDQPQITTNLTDLVCLVNL